MITMLPFLGIVALVSAAVLVRSTRITGWTVTLHALLMVVALMAATDTLGTPKPIWAELRDTDEMEVVAAVYHPGEAIYVWVRADPPRTYALPWDVRIAREMQEATRMSGGALLKRRGKATGNRQSDGWGGDWGVHPLPQPSAPPKEAWE